MPKLSIDNRTIEVPAGTKVIAAAEKLGIIIPRFCYHPGLGSFGACRMCAVKFLEGPVKGIEMSCMTDARDGMVVSTTDPEAMEFRRYVIEWLMLHHPLDCPVCDEGGHCQLQDETVSGGHGIRRYLGPKRTYQDQYLGALVQHEMNRCIHCWRCRNFYQEFAGYRDYGAMQIGNRMYFGRFEDGPLESPFAGNLIDLCPTGVLTDKPARFVGRRWDFERAPSVCLHCSLGCNTTGSARYRQMWRQEGRFNDKVNGYFICDRGRYGFAYESHEERPRRARIAGKEVAWPEAIQAAADRLSQIVETHGLGAVACLGSTRSSLEAQATLKRFCQAVGWNEPYYFSVPSQERQVKAAVSRLDAGLAVSLREIEAADFILVAGADPVNEAPMLALALRQAWRNGGQTAVLDPRPVSLPFQFEHLPLAPVDLDAALGALATEVLRGGPGEPMKDGRPETGDGGKARSPVPRPRSFSVSPALHLKSQIQDRLLAIRQRLCAARRPVIVCGTDVVRESTPALAADLARLLRQAGADAGLFYLLPGANAFGAALLSPAGAGRPPLVEALEAGVIKALVAVESDPYWDYPDRERLKRALDKLELLVVLDYLPSPMVARADIVLPTLTVFERSPSSFVNQEGRLQLAPPVHLGGSPMAQISPELHPPRIFLSHIPGGEPRTAGDILPELAAALSPPVALPVEDLWDWLGRENPGFAKIANLFEPPSGTRFLPLAVTTGAYSPAAALVPDSPPPDHLELLLVDSTFGTEELASYSKHIHQVEEPPRLLMHPEDAARLSLGPGDRVALRLPGGVLEVTLQVAENMALGVIVLPRHRQLDWRVTPDYHVPVAYHDIAKVEG
ncbi:MAG: NADH-quinone oxidoreductase subunit NuoG [Deltaproteobacteria bacterium]|nr:NADH-quinone oxidoreductase subunit NuoG [Deltaproteobacteria bacterium]